ncbi:serine/threonine protein kinase [Murinocardiopsis flavida]|uniref:Serine/threonine protein kinase n=1 Tax=Murinocardiopsis flavida TaxID=645275 RepID=A0A2P8CUX2_9ACTN|nr:tetratricopeptide repeat protein [Murinocardiopsis flavida]PSK88739.1 serine/threonine protein kinase [Murinocardiopsis flavida]
MAEAGQRVGGFRLVRELGAGGFGTVHLGEDAAGRRAAVKLLHPHLANDAQVRRYFVQELATARTVQGFCLAAILDADAEGERPWIATEYIDGPTLAQAVREHGPRTGGDLDRLAVQTITALAAIHAAGVVHRDLKPANILLGPDGARVIDFGIARALDAGTASATRIGTLGYMAPEQVEGTALGPAADLFAWGAVMIHAATGAEAFPGPTQAARIHQVLTGPPQTGDLADPLLGIVLTCTAKDPAHRPTARQVLDMLLTGRTTPPPHEGPTTAAEDDEEARLRCAVEGGDTDAMNSLGVLLRDQGEEGEAEELYRRAITEDGNTCAMINLGVLLRDRGEEGEAEALYRRAITEDGNTCAMTNLGLLLAGRGEEHEAESWFRRAVEGGETYAMYCLGVLLAGRGEEGAAETLYRRAIESGNTRAVIGLGVLLRDRGEVGAAETLYRRAIEGGNADAMVNLGVLLDERGEVGAAEELYRRAITEGASTTAMVNLGALLDERGEVGAAEELYRRAITEGGNTTAMYNLGVLLAGRGERGGGRDVVPARHCRGRRHRRHDQPRFPAEGSG